MRVSTQRLTWPCSHVWWSCAPCAEQGVCYNIWPCHCQYTAPLLVGWQIMWRAQCQHVRASGPSQGDEFASNTSNAGSAYCISKYRYTISMGALLRNNGKQCIRWNIADLLRLRSFVARCNTSGRVHRDRMCILCSHVCSTCYHVGVAIQLPSGICCYAAVTCTPPRRNRCRLHHTACD